MPSMFSPLSSCAHASPKFVEQQARPCRRRLWFDSQRRTPLVQDRIIAQEGEVRELITTGALQAAEAEVGKLH